MKQKQVLELINPIDPALIEEADAQLPAKRRFPRAVRAGLLAACLCLALIGTAFAAAPEAMAALIQRLTVQVAPPEEDPSYSVIGGLMTKYPLSAFSPALIAASEGRDGLPVVSLEFGSWEEVQAFLGRDIPCIWPEEWDTNRFQVLLFHTGSEVLWGVDVYSVDISRQAEIYIDIRTELWTGENASGGLGGAPDGSSITQLSSYSMPNGAVAELIQVIGPESVYQDGTPTGFRPQQCDGYFMRDGILYAVTAFSPVPPQESTEAQLKTVLDSFP